MTWFFLTIIGPFLYAITNHIDKILLSKYFKNGGVGTLILISSLLSALALPFLFFANPSVFDTSIINITILAIIGIIGVAVIWLYLTALDNEEASITVIFYQLIPVFAVILGYFVLGEVLTKMQLVAMAIIILGTTIISFEIDADNHFTLRRQTIFYMLAASGMEAVGSVAFKFVALEETVVTSLFWSFLASTIVGVFIFIFVRPYRENFIEAFQTNSKIIISLNFLNEILFMLGDIVFAFAYLMAPIALVLLTNSFQPIFVVMVGIFLTIFFPKISVEKIAVKHMFQKLLAVAVTGIGTYILLTSS